MKYFIWNQVSLYSLLLLLIGCEDITPLWKGVYQLDNYTLYTNEPCQYNVDIRHQEEEVLVKLELTITYYNQIARNTLPLSIVIEQTDSTHRVREYNTLVQLKENGKWIGEPTQDREFDLTLTHTAIPAIKIRPGSYVLKIYVDELQESSGEIEGVTQIDARFFELEEPKDT